LDGNKFFSKYQYQGINGQSKEKFNCKIYNKVCVLLQTFQLPDSAHRIFQALLSVFKGRVADSSREKETAIERCDACIEDGDGKTKSRFIIKIMCRHGTKSGRFMTLPTDHI
jgi:cell cycle checkpoint control protein RAD9A